MLKLHQSQFECTCDVVCAGSMLGSDHTGLEADPVGASAPRVALIDAQRGVAGCEIWHSWPEELK